MKIAINHSKQKGVLERTLDAGDPGWFSLTAQQSLVLNVF